jgi:hypothetical protein
MRRNFFTLRVFAVATLAWLVIAAFIWLRDLVMIGPSARGLLPHNMFLQVQSMLIWAAFSMIILTAAQRLEFERGRRIVALAVHALLSLILSMADVAIDMLINLITHLEKHGYWRQFYFEVFINTFSYVATAAVGYAWIYHQRLTDTRVGALELQRQLAQARLDVLAKTLQPHFLFNALNSVAALVRLNENPRALQAVVALGDLLRIVLKHRGEALVPLRDELEFTERYVAVEKLRFEDELQVETTVEPGTEQRLVPALLLQPLVENAIRHGVETNGSGRVKIDARKDGDALKIVVGVYELNLRSDAKVTGLGIGLDVTRRRLAYLYGEDGFTLELLVADKQSSVTVRIPNEPAHPDSHRG